MKKLIVILDPAHGSDTPGKRSPGGAHREYLWSRKIVNKLMARLKAEDFIVYITNPQDTEIGLTKRQQFASTVNPVPGKIKFLLSIHNNAAGNGTDWANARGVEIFTSKGKTRSDIYANIIMNQIKKDFPDMKLRPGGHSDMGKEENFTVLMGQGYNAALLEWLFQDNKEDFEMLQDETLNNKLVDSLVASLNQINDTI